MSERSGLARLERTLWDVVTSFSHRDVSAKIARQADHMLPPASWALLEHLDTDGPMRVSDIAACQGLDVSSVTPRLQALERAGLVERGHSPDDRRASVISIGAAGRVALDSIHTARLKILADALSGVEAEDITIANTLLEKLSTRLKQNSERNRDSEVVAPPLP
ncbi:MarR family winged helix-turn-helix transcriptional regulator [Devosia sp. A369]